MRSYNVIRKRLFLPELLRETELGAYPSIMFIQRDFMCSFFPEFPNDAATIARDVPRADSFQSRRQATPTSDELSSGSISTNTLARIAESRQIPTDTTWQVSQDSNDDFQLAPSALSAALSAQERRQLQYRESESLRSVLTPPNLISRVEDGCPDDELTNHRQISRTRHTGNSLRSQGTQSSASTNRTILMPYALGESR